MDRKKLITLIVCVTAILLSVVAGILIYVASVKPNIDDIPDPVIDPDDPVNPDDPVDPDGPASPDNKGDSDTSEVKKTRADGKYNILVFGKDYAGLNTDTIMVISLDLSENKANVIQIPRDTKLVTSRKSPKINTSFSYGVSAMQKADKKATQAQCYENGARMLVSDIEKMLSVEIDYYVLVQLEGFEKIVDAIGGVTIDIENDLDYDDPDQDLHIHLKAGRQVLDGKQALNFVRFRKGYRAADIGRLDAQKIFMTAFMNKILSVQTLETLPALIEQIKQYVSTSMSLKDMTSFGLSALNFKLSDVTFITLPGEAGGSYYYLYPDLTLKVVNEKLNVYEETVEEKELTVFKPDDYTFKYKDAADTDGKTGEDIDSDGIHIPMTKPHTPAETEKESDENKDSGNTDTAE